MKISLILCLFAATACFAEVKVTVNDATFVVGETAIIPCRYESDSGAEPTYEWSRIKDGERERLYVYSPDESESYDSSNITGGRMSVNEDGSFVLVDTQLSDNEELGVLRCEVDLGKPGVAEKDLTLTIALLPEEDPTMTLNAYTEGKQGFDIQDFPMNVGSCMSAPSYPDAEINFFKNGISVEVRQDAALEPISKEQTTSESTDGISKITTRDLIKDLEQSDHQGEFICNIKTKYGDKVFERNYTMPKFNVNYPTSQVKFLEKPDAYLGDTMTLKCVADGFPQPTIKINGEETSEVTIDITADVDGSSYNCSAASFSDLYTVDALRIDEPTFSGIDIKGGVGTVKKGSDVSVQCSASGNPPPSVAWYKGGAKFSAGATLSIPNVMFENKGSYTCRATNGYERLEESSYFDLHVQGLDRVSAEEVEVEGKPEEKVTLECVFEANAKPTITWDVEGVAPSESDEGNTYKSKIEVGPLTPEFSEKVYTCTADNGAGETLANTFKLPAIAASSGATVAIVVVLILCIVVGVVVFVLYRKGIICKKQEKGEESADADIALEINDDDDVEAGNGKPATAAEENEPRAAHEDDKLMNGEDREN